MNECSLFSYSIFHIDFEEQDMPRMNLVGKPQHGQVEMQRVQVGKEAKQIKYSVTASPACGSKLAV